MAFVDKTNLHLQAGNGGNGKLAWRRETHVPLGGPAGGNGGNGGSIYFVGDVNETSLEPLRYSKNIRAANGEDGDIKNLYGKAAKDTYIKVPLGTIVTDEKTGLQLADIVIPEKPYLIAQGGRGGKGNASFKNQLNKAPTLYELGDLGQQVDVILELKQLADVGLVGLPSAGKSTFISKVTAAKPKVAAYHFTTLIPILGAYIYGEDKQNRLIIADIPGLIEGASDGKGLGHEFLKHIQRCKVLVHIISMDPLDNPDPVLAYDIIEAELAKYSSHLLDKKMILVANKMDTEGAQANYELLKQHLKRKKLWPISANEGTGIKPLMKRIEEVYAKEMFDHPEYAIPQYDKSIADCTPYYGDELDRTITVTPVSEGVWEVTSPYIAYWAHKIPLKTQDNMIRFNQKLNSIEFNTVLRENGVANGDTIWVYGNELEFEG